MKKYFFILLFIVLSLNFLSAADLNYSCVEAKELGLVSGQIIGNTGIVKNNANISYTVGLASYEMFDDVIDNQKIFSYSVVVLPGQTINLSVGLPDCNYQIDLFCGEVLLDLSQGQRYGERLLAAEVNKDLGYCERTGCAADEVVSYTPGNKSNGSPMSSDRTNSSEALGFPENDDSVNSVSLGIGGEIVLKFSQSVKNVSGDDFRIFENSGAYCSTYPERAEVSVSQNGIDWTYLGETCQDGSFDLGNLSYVYYIKIKDTTNPSYHSTGDGYDVDGILAEECCLSYCGDGILDEGEECDDGNNVGNDGCSPDCTKTDFEFSCSHLDIAAEGVGLSGGVSEDLSIFLPGNPVLGLLYWEIRGAPDGIIEIENVETAGNLISGSVESGGIWWTRSYAYMLNFNSYLSSGLNHWLVGGLYSAYHQEPDGAAVLAVYENASAYNVVKIKSFNNYLWYGYPGIENSKVINFSFDPEPFDRKAKVIIVTGDTQEHDASYTRTDEIWYQTGVGLPPSKVVGFGSLLAVNNLSGADGEEIDTFEAMVDVPANDDYLALQIFSPPIIGDTKGDSAVLIASAMSIECFSCEDADQDCVCDEDDLCVDSLSGEVVDENGCDPFQFCAQAYCGLSCQLLDFRPKFDSECNIIESDPEEEPYDCTTVVISKEESYFPKCVPLTCAN